MCCNQCGKELPVDFSGPCPKCGRPCAPPRHSTGAPKKLRRGAFISTLLSALLLLRGICALWTPPLCRSRPPWWITWGLRPAAVCFLLCALLALLALLLLWLSISPRSKQPPRS